jgi:thiol-disulfide isomerase/thioredoxin
MSIRDLIAGFLRSDRDVDPGSLPVEGAMPEFAGIAGWLNGGPFTKAQLAGKVVLVDFWTYSCINCIRTLPHVNAWHEAYGGKGLVIIGVHTPEFEFEKDPENVKKAVERYGINYAVAVDNDYAMWNAYRNHYWPAHYFIDGKGNIRYHHFGEGNYAHSESVIRALLAEAGAAPAHEAGPQAAATVDFGKVGSPETYLGSDRLESLGSPESVRMGSPQRYSSVKDPAVNIFYFKGSWTVNPDHAVPDEPGASVVFRYRASTANLVMDGGGLPLKAEVTVDGRPLTAENKGADVILEDGRSYVVVKDGRLYNLVDMRGAYGTHLLEIVFLDPSAKCYAFTFG